MSGDAMDGLGEMVQFDSRSLAEEIAREFDEWPPISEEVRSMSILPEAFLYDVFERLQGFQPTFMEMLKNKDYGWKGGKECSVLGDGVTAMVPLLGNRYLVVIARVSVKDEDGDMSGVTYEMVVDCSALTDVEEDDAPSGVFVSRPYVPNVEFDLKGDLARMVGVLCKSKMRNNS